MLVAALLLFIARAFRLTIPYVKYDIALACLLLTLGGWGPEPARDVILDTVSFFTDGFVFDGFGVRWDMRIDNYAVIEPLSQLCAGRGHLPLSGPHRYSAWRFGPRGHYHCGVKPQWWALWVLVVLTVIGLSMLLAQVYRAFSDPLASAILGRFRTAYTVPLNSPAAINLIRDAFRRTNTRADPAEDPNHTHPKSAAARNSALSMAQSFASAIGSELFDVQQSAASFRKFRGSKAWIWAVDALVPQRPLGEGVRLVNDTDYHADMHTILTESTQPVLVGTLNPSCVARTTDEYAYTFDADNNVLYNVSGGATFSHKLWNYNFDHLRVDRTGLVFRDFTTFNVERKHLDEDHELVCLIPEVKQRTLAPWAPFWWLLFTPFLGGWTFALIWASAMYLRWMFRELEAPVLSRLEPARRTKDPNVPVVLALRVMTRGEPLQVSLGLPGKYASTNIPASEFDALVMSTNDKNLATLARVRNVCGLTDDVSAAPVAVVANALGSNMPMLVQKAQAHVVTFAALEKGCTPDIKLAMEDFGSAFVAGGNFQVARSDVGDAHTIAERIKGPVQGRKTPVMNPFIAGCTDDFVREVLGKARGTLTPVGPEVVRLNQSRPSQQAILDRADGTTLLVDCSKPLQSFQKAEVVMNPKANRNISTLDAPSKSNYSRYMYALQTFMCDGESNCWYAPGHSPSWIAGRVASICVKSEVVDNADASKLDARISEVNRAFEQAFVLAAFRPEHREELMELVASQQGRRFVTMFGQKYDQGDGRASGSPETTIFNTLSSGFHTYLGYRNCKRADGTFLAHADAFELLREKAIAFGDDLVVGDMQPGCLHRAGGWCGHVYESDVVTKGNLGVNFLNRFYTRDVWCGSPNSCVRLDRALPKLYTSTKNQLTPPQRLEARFHSYALSDQYTPILGELVGRYRSVFAAWKQPPDSWWANFSFEEQWPNAASGDFNEYAIKWLPGFNNTKFQQWLDGLDQGYDAWLTAPVFCTLPRHEPAKVLGQVGQELNPGPSVQVKRRGKAAAGGKPKTKAGQSDPKTPSKGKEEASDQAKTKAKKPSKDNKGGKRSASKPTKAPAKSPDTTPVTKAEAPVVAGE